MVSKEFIESKINNTHHTVEVNAVGVKEIIILRPKLPLTKEQIVAQEKIMFDNGFKVYHGYETIYYFEAK